MLKVVTHNEQLFSGTAIQQLLTVLCFSNCYWFDGVSYNDLTVLSNVRAI